MSFISKYKVSLSILASVFIIVGIFVFTLRTKTYPERVLLVGKMFDVEVADNTVLMAKGLSGHKPLAENEGMIFVFEKPDNYGFWMKDMTFPIDIVWFDKDRKVVHIENSLSPESYPKTFYPGADSLYVLEISSGLSKKMGLKIGTTFEFIKSNDRKLEF